jgi:hypothetical protein
MDGEMSLARLERDPLGHRPAGEGTVPLEAEVVVQAPSRVPLNDEQRLLPPPLAARERLRRLLRIPLAPVLLERHARIMHRRLT